MRRSTTSRRNVLAGAVIGLALLGALRTPPSSSPGLSSTAGAAPFAGVSNGCSVKDPTTSGCVTPITAHGLEEIAKAFGGYRQGPKLVAAGCWDAHAWNPASDHPQGRGCDIYPGKAGVRATGTQLDNGWELAKWLRANSAPLRVRYVIWQGRIWQADTNRDTGGWGTAYTGGGVYNPTDVVGGHYDHVHVSFEKK